ncbi:hypothetical protein [Acinetobacter sp.]|uniref:hypothetical protein n=1 Tax=Acinetobacter sp. TaxID=472 RepID=UPI003BAEAF4D
MLHQKMIGWTVRKWRDVHQEKQLALNHLAQRTTHVEVGELIWISVATAAPLQAKIDAFKKLYLRTVCIKGYDREQRT